MTIHVVLDLNEIFRYYLSEEEEEKDRSESESDEEMGFSLFDDDARPDRYFMKEQERSVAPKLKKKAAKSAVVEKSKPGRLSYF